MPVPWPARILATTQRTIKHSCLLNRKTVHEARIKFAAMNYRQGIFSTANGRIAGIAFLVVAFDQLTKHIVLRYLGYEEEKIIIEGFFRLVHWGNTGAAWSLFRGNNALLAWIAIVALVVMFFSRHHFDSRSLMGQFAFGLIFGGIIGNLIDRLWAKHVIDFLYLLEFNFIKIQ